MANAKKRGSAEKGPRKVVIGYRKSCNPDGTGLSHYIIIPGNKKQGSLR